MAIGGINPLSSFNAVSSPTNEVNKMPGAETSSVSFGDMLNEALNKINNLQLQSANLTQDFAAGRTDNIHEVMIAAEKADITLQFAMQIRNKILDAYNEIMRMQI